MNLGDVQVVVRTRSTRESIDLAFPFIARLGGRRYMLLILAVSVAETLLACACKFLLDLTWADVWWLALPLGVWTQGIFTIAAGELMFSSELRLRRVVPAFFRRFVSYSTAMFTTRLLLVLSAFTIIFAPWLWGRVLFVPEAVLLEQANASKAGSRAARLAGPFRPALIELLFWQAMILGFGVITSESLGRGLVEFTLQLSLPLGNLMEESGSLYALFGWFVALPVACTVRFLSYIDGRTRSDAWDVQIKLQRIVQLEEQRE